jgi:glutaminyl-peptide cyclotransferase
MKNVLLAALLFGLFSCSSNKEKLATDEKTSPIINVPVFNRDSAYHFIQTQVDFGPRVPNSTSHQKTGDFLVAVLKGYGATVVEQNFTAETFDGQRLTLRNIIASYYPEKQKRMLLAAHWDTRPFADKDSQQPNAPLDGANDGASGVGVLLEIARVLHANDTPEVGIDIILFDGEDWGEPENQTNKVSLPKGLDSWWCLGSQYWSKNKHKGGYAAYYGILLDMVGGTKARFYREEFSQRYAPSIVDKVWSTAETLGYSHVFVNTTQGSVLDDHYYVNTLGKIPMIDIINYDPATNSFGDFHHTTNDNMEGISKETLQIVGNTLLQVLYHEGNK